jgi:hypothetical protein
MNRSSILRVRGCFIHIAPPPAAPTVWTRSVELLADQMTAVRRSDAVYAVPLDHRAVRVVYHVEWVP